MDKAKMKVRLAMRKAALEKAYEAYLALLDGGVQSYTIEGRELTRLDLDALSKEIKRLENEIDALEAICAGGKPRRAVGILPRDW